MFWTGLFPHITRPLTFGPRQTFVGQPGPSGLFPDPREDLPLPWPQMVEPFNTWNLSIFAGGPASNTAAVGAAVRPSPRMWPQMPLNNSWAPAFVPLGWPRLRKRAPTAGSGF